VLNCSRGGTPLKHCRDKYSYKDNSLLKYTYRCYKMCDYSQLGYLINTVLKGEDFGSYIYIWFHVSIS